MAAWYVIGHDPMRKARRTFALQRMKAVRVLKTRFVRRIFRGPVTWAAVFLECVVSRE